MTEVMEIETDGAIEALERLVAIARTDTGQARRVADFLLAWWNADALGGFDLTHLWNVDEAIADDMLRVFGLISQARCYPDSFVPRQAIMQIVEEWRGANEDA